VDAPDSGESAVEGHAEKVPSTVVDPAESASEDEYERVEPPPAYAVAANVAANAVGRTARRGRPLAARSTKANLDGTRGDFHAGAFDLQRFQVIDSGDDIVFRVQTRDLTPTFGSPLGAQLVDVYVHDSGAAPADTSTMASFPQRNYAIAAGSAWSRLIEVQGFGRGTSTRTAPPWERSTFGRTSCRGSSRSACRRRAWVCRAPAGRSP
jgi:hypothetical protein